MSITALNNTLKIGKETIPFVLERGRPRSIRLSFLDAGVLKIETGDGKLGDFEMDFLRQKTRWILKAFHNRRTAAGERENFLTSLHKEVTVLGSPVPVEFVPSDSTSFRFKKTAHFKVFAPEKFFHSHKKALLYHSLRRFSEHFLSRRLDHWKAITNLEINQLRVKDLRSKWGSCSTQRNINLNWQLIFLEEDIIDYVIVHELMHLLEMNHGSKFWAHVERYIPDYRKARTLLRQKQWMVGILK